MLRGKNSAVLLIHRMLLVVHVMILGIIFYSNLFSLAPLAQSHFLKMSELSPFFYWAKSNNHRVFEYFILGQVLSIIGSFIRWDNIWFIFCTLFFSLNTYFAFCSDTVIGAVWQWPFLLTIAALPFSLFLRFVV